MQRLKATTSLNDEEVNLLKITYETLIEKVKCSICNDRIKKVVGIECGHTFCRPCIVKQLVKDSHCPLCKKYVDKNRMIVNKSLTLFYEHLQQLATQCERNLPKEVLLAIKKPMQAAKVLAETPTSSTATRRSRRSASICKTVEGDHILDQRKDEEALDVPASTSTNIFETRKDGSREKNKLGPEELKSPIRMPSQFPNESSVISQYSIDPEDKVKYWLDTSKTDAIPTQDRPIDTPKTTQSTLISVSQARANVLNMPAFKTPIPAPQKIPGKAIDAAPMEESQADSIKVCRRTRNRVSTSLNKSIESEVSMEEGPELFQSQTDEYQNKKEEKRLNKIVGQEPTEKPKFKGFGLRKKKVAPIRYDDEDESESSQVEVANAREENLNVSIEDFLADKDKQKPSRHYTNKKLNPTTEMPEDQAPEIVQVVVSPQKPEQLGKRRRLSLQPVVKSTSIVEVASPESSPSKDVQKKCEIGKTPSPGFSRYIKMKSDFKEKRKIVPLNISTTSAHNAPLSKKSISPNSREMIIDSASDKSSSKLPPKKPSTSESPAEEVNQIETQSSVGLIENSLPSDERTPKALRLSTSAEIPAPKSAEQNVTKDENSFRPPLPIPPTQESAVSTTSTGSRKRKTFTLESNTGDIMGTSPIRQKLSQAISQMNKTLPLKKPLRQANRVQFFRRGKLGGAVSKNYIVNFFKLGYLSPIAVKRNLKFTRKRVRDAAVQTSPVCISQMDTLRIEKSTVPRGVSGQSVLCQTSFGLLNTTVGAHDSLLVENEKQDDKVIEEMDEDFIEKSQETVKNHVFEAPVAKPKEDVQETCPIDSNDIIPASMPIPSQHLKRQMDSSSLSMSPTTATSVETLLSLNESEYELQQDRLEKPTKRRKLVTRKSSQQWTQDSAVGKSEKRNTKAPAPSAAVVDEKAAEKEMQWTYTSQDAAVLAVAMDDLKYAREKADAMDTSLIIESTPNESGNVTKVAHPNLNIAQDEELDKSLHESMKKSSVKGSAISPFLEDSDSMAEQEKENEVIPATVEIVEKVNESSTKSSSENDEKKMVCKESDEEEEEVPDVIEATPKAKKVHNTQRVEVEAAKEPVVSLIFTSLGRNQIAQIQKFCKSFKSCSVNTSMNTSVTHLVVPHSDDMNTVSTLKFYLAVAKGLWVVSIQWISDCIASGKIIPEEPYEMNNMHGCDGPRKSRQANGGIFQDFEMFCLDGNYTGVSKEQIKDIICCGGGLPLKSIQEPQKKKYRLVICATENIDEALLEESNNIVLMMDWVLETVENFRLASAFNYLPLGLSVTQVSQAHFDLPADMLRFESSDTLH